MSTIKRYQQEVYLTALTAQITAITPIAAGRCLVTLDQTIFAPAGGGQSCDGGTINDFPVTDVTEKDGEIMHRLDGDPAQLSTLLPGMTVHLSLDWARRFDHMQRHCGEHIMSGVLHRLFGGVNRGFHMGDAYMTIDISLEDQPTITQFTWEMAKEAELAANQIIWKDLPISISRFATRKEAEKLPLRKPLAFDEDISIVTIGDFDHPADCVACCGTHPNTTGQVGMIKLYKVESNKGMFRLYFEAGKRAFCKYQDEFDAFTTLSNQLSAGADDLLQKYAAQQKKQQAVRSQLASLRRVVILREAESLRKAFSAAPQADRITASGAQLSVGNFVRYYDILTLNDLLNLAKALLDEIPQLLFLVHRPSATVLLCSAGKPDCGKLVKENISIYGGKGGGNTTTARAIFDKAEYVDLFIDLIDKHLR